MNFVNQGLAGIGLGLMLSATMLSPAHAQPAGATINFGDDSGEWANDGECDDPRFQGKGAASLLLDSDLMRDASDCRAALAKGTITFVGTKTGTPADAIDFGDDSGDWANDGECDDPRFRGAGSATELIEADLLKDASDCRAAYDAGTVSYIGDDAQAIAVPAIDFGDDSGDWTHDGECDDPRFRGPGSATELVAADLYKDATDCRTAYEAGTVTLVDESANNDSIDYGDDRSQWANDGECDDPRFSGRNVAQTLLDSDIGRDASDCRAAVAAGATFDGRSIIDARYSTIVEFDYGNDTSKWANDGQCDDLRFKGPGTDKKLLADDIYADATDCRTLEAEGKVQIRPVYTPEYAAAAPYDSSHIDFGDNSSDYSQDGQCDDPRFEGPGAAYVMFEDDAFGDADDCREAYEAGQISLIDAD